ncbi:hypothetical protein C8R48DRAFT_678805 [Suillus tomentosus]|nr:hypothetical protein C8R48DRAFT_678805 [Suillus tomentosus]
MPPRTVTSPKKKRSKRKGSEASKAGLPKKTRAADVAEVPGAVPLISLGLTAAEVGDNAPRRSGHPNAGTGGRNVQLKKIRSALQSKPRTYGCKGTTSLGPDIPEVPPPYSSHDLDSHPDVPAMDIIHTGPSFTLQQPGGRFGFAAPSTTEIAHSDTTELNLQALNDPYVAIRTKVVEQRVPDAIAEQRARDTITEQRARDAITEQSVFSEQNLDPALHQEDDAVRAQYCLRLLGSEEHSDSKGSSSSDDSDDSDDEDADKDEEDNGKDAEEGNNNDTVKDSQDFGWGEVGQHQKEHPGFLEDALPSQPAVAHALTPEFEFQYSRDEDDVIAQTSLDKTSGPPDGSPGLQGQRSQHMETITSKPNNVLQCHHKKNGKPRLPEPESLKLLDQVTKSSVQPSKNKKFRSSHGGPTPNQLSWYRPHCKSFLEDANAELLLVMWDTNGKQFEAGKYSFVLIRSGTHRPEQKFNMTLLLYDDLSTWRSDLKKTAISTVPVSYSLVPPLSVPVQECAAWIKHAAAELIKGSFFLRFGVDEQIARGEHKTLLILPVVKPTIPNCAKDARDLPHGIAPFMFGFGCCSGNFLSFTNIFNCVLDGLAKNEHGKSYPNFSMKDYGPIYCRMLELLKYILEDAYHGPRLLAQLQEWAAAGWQGS